MAAWRFFGGIVQEMACVSVTTSWVDDVISPDSVTWPLLWDDECFAKDFGHERLHGGFSLRELGKKSCRYASLSVDDGPIIISNNDKGFNSSHPSIGDLLQKIQALGVVCVTLLGVGCLGQAAPADNLNLVADPVRVIGHYN